MLVARRLLQTPVSTTIIVLWIFLLLTYTFSCLKSLHRLEDHVPPELPASSPSPTLEDFSHPLATITPPATVSPLDTIPRTIWYKLGPNGLSDQAKEWTDTCITQNPTYTAKFMTDASSEVWVRENFQDRQDIIDTYMGLQVLIHKADLLRYLFLYAEGGLWSDLDVSCETTSIEDWIPERFIESAGLVIGWEFDIGWGPGFVREFTTWVMMAKPGSPHLLQVIDNIVEDVRRKTEEHQVPISGLTLNMTGDVVDFTGPRRLTRGVFQSLEALRPDTIEDEKKSVELLQEPKLIGDVLIMPAYSFSHGTNTYTEKDVQAPILVTHHFAGTWKNDHGGEQREADNRA